MSGQKYRSNNAALCNVIVYRFILTQLSNDEQQCKTCNLVFGVLYFVFFLYFLIFISTVQYVHTHCVFCDRGSPFADYRYCERVRSARVRLR